MRDENKFVIVLQKQSKCWERLCDAGVVCDFAFVCEGYVVVDTEEDSFVFNRRIVQRRQRHRWQEPLLYLRYLIFQKETIVLFPVLAKQAVSPLMSFPIIAARIARALSSAF